VTSQSNGGTSQSKGGPNQRKAGISQSTGGTSQSKGGTSQASEVPVRASCTKGWSRSIKGELKQEEQSLISLSHTYTGSAAMLAWVPEARETGCNCAAMLARRRTAANDASLMGVQ